MINVKINRDEAYRYMGINGTADPHTKIIADECEGRLKAEITPNFCWTFVEIMNLTNDSVNFSDHVITLRGNDISKHLSGCFGAVFLCATLGVGADKLLRTLKAEDMAKTLICDALASAAVENVCDIAEKEISDRFPDKFMTWRFSPGYGDFPLDTQKDFLIAANAQRSIGLCVNDSGILIPTKSVTAVIGLSEIPIESKKRGCISCNMRERCVYRKNGGHCGT